MTIDDIKSKLHAVLNRNPADEQEVVYAFVKIRKMLEHDGQKYKYARINLFCNWLLHVELENSTVGNILNSLDRAFRTFDEMRPCEFDPEGIVAETLSLQIFRHELVEFLSANNLPTVWVEDQFAWVDLLKFYGEEVRDTPLKIKDDKYPLVFIAQVAIYACEPDDAIAEANPEDEYIGLKWEFTLKDGRKFTRSFTTNIPKALPNWRKIGMK